MVDALTALDSTGSYQLIGDMLGISVTTVLVLVVIISVWTLIWKGFALWKAVNKKSVSWFIVFLIFNTVGILEILYIFVFSKINIKKKSEKNNVNNVTKNVLKKKK